MGASTIYDHKLFTSKDHYGKYIEAKLRLLKPELRDVMRKVVAFDPQDRYSSCTEFLVDLEYAFEDFQMADKASQNAQSPGLHVVARNESPAHEMEPIGDIRTKKDQLRRPFIGPKRRRPPHTPQHRKVARHAKPKNI